jgi:hypothetical protein
MLTLITIMCIASATPATASTRDIQVESQEKVVELIKTALTGWLRNRDSFEFYDCHYSVAFGALRERKIPTDPSNFKDPDLTRDRRVQDGDGYFQSREVIDPRPLVKKEDPKRKGFYRSSSGLGGEVEMGYKGAMFTTSMIMNGGNLYSPDCKKPVWTFSVWGYNLYVGEDLFIERFLGRLQTEPEQFRARLEMIDGAETLIWSYINKTTADSSFHYEFHVRKDYNYLPTRRIMRSTVTGKITGDCQLLGVREHQGRWFPLGGAAWSNRNENEMIMGYLIKVESLIFEKPKDYRIPTFQFPPGHDLHYICDKPKKAGVYKFSDNEVVDWTMVPKMLDVAYQYYLDRPGVWAHDTRPKIPPTETPRPAVSISKTSRPWYYYLLAAICLLSFLRIVQLLWRKRSSG